MRAPIGWIWGCAFGLLSLVTPYIADAQQSCGMAVPSCFAGCGVGRVRTAAGQCVPSDLPPASKPLQAATPLLSVQYLPAAPSPTAAPQNAQPGVGLGVGLGVGQGAEATEGEASPSAAQAPADGDAGQDGQPAAPAEPQCCLVPLTVVADGSVNLGDHAEHQTLLANVRINGQLVGQTPFRDELPAGDYVVEVEFNKAAPQAALAKLRIDAPVALAARYPLMPTPEQQAQLSAYRNAQAQQQAAQASASEAERVERLRSDHQAAMAEWEASTAADRSSRDTLLPLSVIGMAGGGAMTVAGIVMVALASNTDGDATAAFERWQRASNPATRDVEASELESLQERRDLQQGLGVTGLAVGSAVLIAGIVTYALLPDVPKAPTKPPQLALTPLAGPSFAGGNLQLRF